MRHSGPELLCLNKMKPQLKKRASCSQRRDRSTPRQLGSHIKPTNKALEMKSHPWQLKQLFESTHTQVHSGRPCTLLFWPFGLCHDPSMSDRPMAPGASGHVGSCLS